MSHSYIHWECACTIKKEEEEYQMAKEEKTPKKATAQVKSEAEFALNENEFNSPAYDYGLEGFYGYPGYSDYPYPTTSEFPVTGDDFYPYDYGTYDYTIDTIPGDPDAQTSIFPFFGFPFFGFPFFRPFPFFGFPFFSPFW